jgi:hypothetical protein
MEKLSWNTGIVFFIISVIVNLCCHRRWNVPYFIYLFIYYIYLPEMKIWFIPQAVKNHSNALCEKLYYAGKPNFVISGWKQDGFPALMETIKCHVTKFALDFYFIKSAQHAVEFSKPSDVTAQWVPHIDISQCRLLFGFFLLYTGRIPFELLDGAALLWRESCGGGGQIVFKNLTI